ncbi:hypothetical protein X551_01126 [Methylibium sp. T29]|nr:hypothetical protein X551_01126 [Methylibium sp. T29]EWS60429.1 hypothetical protein Y694_01754 [Methylibium sp. T29-B]
MSAKHVTVGTINSSVSSRLLGSITWLTLSASLVCGAYETWPDSRTNASFLKFSL